MNSSEKRKAMILLGLVVVMLVIVVANLRQLEFQPGMPVPELVRGNVVSAPQNTEPVVVMHVNEFVKMLLVLTLSIAILYVIIRSLRACSWRNVWSYVRQAIIVCAMAISLPFLIMMLNKSKSNFVAELHPPQSPIRTAPLGAVPPLVLWLVGMLLLAACLFVIWRIARPKRQIGTTDLIGQEAQGAWLALRSGVGLREVIIRCYRQMSLVLAEKQGLERKEFMTTGEFETLLAEAGFPSEPIWQLTRLFERIRYGKGQPVPADEQHAVQCLEAIVLFCQSKPRTDAHE